MGRQLEKPVVRRMFLCYAVRRSVQDAALACGVSRSTVTRYRDGQQWDALADRLMAEALAGALEAFRKGFDAASRRTRKV
ncbi:MAG: hypothetical protein HY719_17230 [Planctomycetes bacterium]|nr:hypothetical protein [Planctomycetota bacterium]